MTSDTLTDLGAVVFDNVPFRSSLFNAMDKVRLTNQSGGSVVTGDVLCLDLDNNSSFISASSTYAYRIPFVVPENIDANGDGATKTILSGEAGWIYRPGAYVPLATVDEAVAVGEYLAFSSTAKKFTGMGITTAQSFPPHGARAMALAAAAEAGQIPVMLLEVSANPYMAAARIKTADIALTASEVKVIDYNSSLVASGGLIVGGNTTQMVAPSDQVGVKPYEFIACVEWSGAPASGSYAAIRVNGTTEIARHQGPLTAPLVWCFSTQYELAATQYAELIVWTSSAGLSIKYSQNYSPVFAAARLGD